MKWQIYTVSITDLYSELNPILQMYFHPSSASLQHQWDFLLASCGLDNQRNAVDQGRKDP